MSLNEQKNKYRALDDWFKTPQGRHVGEALARRLVAVRDLLSGTTLVQLGICGDNPWLVPLMFRRKWLLTPCLNSPEASLIASPNGLPFDRNSVDCVVAPLTMEAFGRDKNPLDEIDRVLKPMGYVIFWGVNPISVWGLALRVGYVPFFGDSRVTLTSSLILKQALLNRGYRQCMLETFYYIPPVKQSSWIDRLAFLNEMGKMISPCPAGFYCLIVQKVQQCTPNWLLQANGRGLLLQSQAAWLASANWTHRP